MGPHRSTRAQPAPATYQEEYSLPEPANKKKTKKQKLPMNKERFELLENQLAHSTEALGRLTANHSSQDPPDLSTLPSILEQQDSTAPHLSRASTPKSSS